MNPISRLTLCILTLTAIFLIPAAPADETSPNPLKSVKTFMCQLQELDKPDAVANLAKTNYDMLLVEPTFNLKDSPSFDARAMVKTLHDGKPGRIVLAFLNVGEADDTRTYWTSEWHAAEGKTPARPGFVIGPDAFGDPHTNQVRYWRPRWQALFLGKQGILEKLMADGFDGVYLDGLEAYDDDAVDDAADRDKVEPAEAMVTFVTAIRDHIRKLKSDALVVSQDAPYLLNENPKLASAIDGIVFEDTWYSGKDGADWNNADAGDIPNKEQGEDSTLNLIRQYHKYLQAGIPVFTIDYCVNETHAAQVYSESSREGFIPLVTRVSVDNITPTPPPATQP